MSKWEKKWGECVVLSQFNLGVSVLELGNEKTTSAPEYGEGVGISFGRGVD